MSRYIKNKEVRLVKLVKKASVRTIMYFFLIFTVVVSVFPILWVIMSSFKTNGEIMSGPFVLPSQINFDAYRYLFENYDFLTYTLWPSTLPVPTSLPSTSSRARFSSMPSSP